MRSSGDGGALLIGSPRRILGRDGRLLARQGELSRLDALPLPLFPSGSSAVPQRGGRDQCPHGGTEDTSVSKSEVGRLTAAGSTPAGGTKQDAPDHVESLMNVGQLGRDCTKGMRKFCKRARAKQVRRSARIRPHTLYQTHYDDEGEFPPYAGVFDDFVLIPVNKYDGYA